MDLYLKYQSVFDEYGIQDISVIAKHWREPHRFYHNEEHLTHLIGEIEKLYEAEVLKNKDEKDMLLMAAYFHDLIYDPTRYDNEEKSAELFLQMTSEHPNKKTIFDIIIDTKTHEPQSEISKIFSDIDMQIVTHSDFTGLLEWEMKIFKEYQFIDYTLYKVGRLNLLRKIASKYSENAVNLQALIDFVEKYRPKIGIYAGSFNPFHKGHLNILEKATKIFDKVILARGINPEKKDSIEIEKLDVPVLKYKQCENFIGFLTDYISSKENYAELTLIRGLRNGDDLDYEINQLRFMEEMKDDLKVIFIACDKQYEHISSSAIRNLEKIDKEFGKRYIP